MQATAGKRKEPISRGGHTNLAGSLVRAVYEAPSHGMLRDRWR